MDKIDKKIVKMLADGSTQSKISKALRSDNIYPNSVSIIEKRIKTLKEKHNAKGMFDLALRLRELEIV